MRYESDERSLVENVSTWGVCKSKKRCLLIAYCLRLVCSMGTLVRRKKIWRYSARKVMKFGQIMTDILVNVSCKFEMYILKLLKLSTKMYVNTFLYVTSI